MDADYDPSPFETEATWLDSARAAKIRFKRDEELADQLRGIPISLKYRKHPADYVRISFYTFCSRKLLDVLLAARVNISYVEVSAHRTRLELGRLLLGSRIRAQYFFFRVLDEFDCIDLTASEYDDLEFWSVRKLVLNESTIAAGSPAFYVRNLPLLCVRDELKSAILESGCTGVSFEPISKWRL